MADAIVAYVEEVEAESIVIGTHGRTGLRNVVMGSVAEDVIRKSNVPVLVVREGMRLPAD